VRHGSLFSGIGGFDLAAQWAGWENVFQCEKDEYCLAVLKKNFPHVKRFGDIKETNFRLFRGLIDVLSGGFPCQPFSQAGKRGGVSDDRYLWPEYERAIDEIRPRWVVGENVIGIKNMALDLVCQSLESRDYEVRPVVIPASAVGAWHRRERIWIIAHRDGALCSGGIRPQPPQGRNTHALDTSLAENSEPPNVDSIGLKGRGALRFMDREDATQSGSEKYGQGDSETLDISPRPTDLNREGLQGYPRHEVDPQGRSIDARLGFSSYWESHWLEVVAGFCRNNDGVPSRMDRIKSLGNAIVPQVAHEIFKAINEIESQ